MAMTDEERAAAGRTAQWIFDYWEWHLAAVHARAAREHGRKQAAAIGPATAKRDVLQPPVRP